MSLMTTPADKEYPQHPPASHRGVPVKAYNGNRLLAWTAASAVLIFSTPTLAQRSPAQQLANDVGAADTNLRQMLGATCSRLKSGGGFGNMSSFLSPLIAEAENAGLPASVSTGVSVLVNQFGTLDFLANQPGAIWNAELSAISLTYLTVSDAAATWADKTGQVNPFGDWDILSIYLSSMARCAQQ